MGKRLSHSILYAGSIIEAQADRPKNTSLFYNPRGKTHWEIRQKPHPFLN